MVFLQKLFLPVFLVLISSLFLFSQGAFPQTTEAIRKGNAHELARHFDQQIDLTFSDVSNTYSSRQAEVILQKFFSKIEPSFFSHLQQGTSMANNTRFVLGNLHSSNGVYKVYLFFIQKNGRYVLRELRFEK